MKYNITLFFCILVFMASCSNELSEAEDTNTQEIASSKTLSDLKAFNASFESETSFTRGWWDNNGIRIGRILKADLGGAIACMGDNKALVGIAAGMVVKGGTAGAWIGGSIIAGIALYGAAPASYRSYQIQYPYAYSIDDLYNMHNTTTNYCVKIAQQDVASFLIDSIGACITIPNSMKFLLLSGMGHNKIVHQYMAGKSDTPMRAPITPIVGDSEEMSYALQIFTGEDLESSFSNAWLYAEQYTTSAGFDYSSYIADHEYESENVTETISLFLSAYDSSVNSLSSIISLVNGYINIIEADDEFSTEERYQIYAGLIVAVYSFDLWNGKLHEIYQ